MSVESMAIALHHSRAKGAGKLVLIGIANHDGDGGAWPSVATLARYACVTERQTQKLVAELEALGEIRRHVSAGGNHNTADHLRPNLYEFKLVCPPSCDRTKNHKVRGMSILPELFTGVSPTTPGVAHDRGGVSSTTPEPSLNQTTRSKEETQPYAREAKPPRMATNEQYAAAIGCKQKPPRYRDRSHTYEQGNRFCTWCGEAPAPSINYQTGEVA